MLCCKIIYTHLIFWLSVCNFLFNMLTFILELANMTYFFSKLCRYKQLLNEKPEKKKSRFSFLANRYKCQASMDFSENDVWDTNWDGCERPGKNTTGLMKYIIMVCCAKDGRQLKAEKMCSLADHFQELFEEAGPIGILGPKFENGIPNEAMQTFYAALPENLRPQKNLLLEMEYLEGETFYCADNEDEDSKRYAYVEGAGLEKMIFQYMYRPDLQDHKTLCRGTKKNTISCQLMFAPEKAIQYFIGRLLQIPRFCYPDFTMNLGSICILKVLSDGKVFLSQISNIDVADTSSDYSLNSGVGL